MDCPTLDSLIREATRLRQSRLWATDPELEITLGQIERRIDDIKRELGHPQVDFVLALETIRSEA